MLAQQPRMHMTGRERAEADFLDLHPTHSSSSTRTHPSQALDLLASTSFVPPTDLRWPHPYPTPVHQQTIKFLGPHFDLPPPGIFTIKQPHHLQI
eukprot:764514-Hanusia_phi.AAC.5